MKTWDEAKEELESITLFLVHRTGPTVYQIKDEEKHSHRVILGERHSCSCKEKGVCVHILFVLLKVLRIPSTNPLSKKCGFSDPEIDIALAGNFEERPRPKFGGFMRRKCNSNQTPENNTEGFVERQMLSDVDENICPICQDDMKADDALTWCRIGCGNNVHAKCMKMYAQYKSATKKDIIRCPLCRENWGPSALQFIIECMGTAKKKPCASVSCYSCNIKIRGEFRRCVDCSIYDHTNSNAQFTECKRMEGALPVDFCKPCFVKIGKAHTKHNFVSSQTDDSIWSFEWQHIINPRRQQQHGPRDDILGLQNRELTANDYDLLLELDKPQSIAVDDIILSSLKNCMSSPSCWCDNSESNGDSKILPCGHIVHSKCCHLKLTEALDKGHWMLEDIRCPVESCCCQAFKGLSRRKKKKMPNCANDSAQTLQNSAGALHPNYQKDLFLEGAKLSSHALSVDATEEANNSFQERRAMKKLDISRNGNRLSKFALSRGLLPKRLSWNSAQEYKTSFHDLPSGANDGVDRPRIQPHNGLKPSPTSSFAQTTSRPLVRQLQRDHEDCSVEVICAPMPINGSNPKSNSVTSSAPPPKGQVSKLRMLADSSSSSNHTLDLASFRNCLNVNSYQSNI